MPTSLRVDTATSYDAASSCIVENQVEYTCDSWGNVTKIEQDRDSVVGGGGAGDYEMAFEYDEDGTTGVTSAFTRIHRTKVTYPAGTEMSFFVGSDLDSIGLPTQVNHMLGRVERVDITPGGVAPTPCHRLDPPWGGVGATTDRRPIQLDTPRSSRPVRHAARTPHRRVPQDRRPKQHRHQYLKIHEPAY